MFDFTTTTILNNPADVIEINPIGDNKTKGLLRIGNHMFPLDQVSAIYRNAYQAPVNGMLKILDVADLNSKAETEAGAATIVRVEFFLRRSGDVSGLYSNDMVFNGKDFHYEWNSTKHADADAVAKLINKIAKLYGDNFLKVYADGNALVFESDNYGVFQNVKVEAQVPSVSNCTCDAKEWCVLADMEGAKYNLTTGADCDSETYEKVTTAEFEIHMPNNGAGTYDQLIRDLRLPTMENMRWTSPNADEMPVPGAQYNQYTIHMVSCRGVLGGSAVGEVTHSKTTHVFFVPICNCTGKEDELGNAINGDTDFKALLFDAMTQMASVADVGATVDTDNADDKDVDVMHADETAEIDKTHNV